jgi:2-polyprenyl-3-methyl-5-hydroxy-6-metoxy-1,4-benzoquinol methylase
LEWIGHCPACGAQDRQILYSGLSDRIFFTAPGEWTMWRCAGCRSGYLDPRPTRETIGLAYGRYYTHAPGERPEKSLFSRFRQALGNDYRNARFNTRLPAIPFAGRLAVGLLPQTRNGIELEYRFLPPFRRGARLLDVGCGNGDYLRVAHDAGWQVMGVEPDPEAAKIASADGFEVRSSLHDWSDQAGTFDYVTASHVIEHVHDPGEFLSDIHSLLVRGGGLYIQTPNMDAPTHERFGPYWRGLEPPRHLTLFAAQAAADLLGRTGFKVDRFVDSPGAAPFLVEQSLRIEGGLDPYTGERVTAAPSAATNIANPPAANASEFLTITALKQG